MVWAVVLTSATTIRYYVEPNLRIGGVGIDDIAAISG